MKNLFKILVIVAIVLVVFIYFDNPVQENELLKGSNNAGQVIPEDMSKMVESESIFTRPKSGSSTLIGKPSSEVLEMLGKPSRVEPSMYGYEWWVYNSSFSTYQLVGVSEGIVTQVFSFGTGADVTPYKIGQSIEDIYRFTMIQSEITISIDSKYIYIFPQ